MKDTHLSIINFCLPQASFPAFIQNPMKKKTLFFCGGNQRDANFRVGLQKYIIHPCSTLLCPVTITPGLPYIRSANLIGCCAESQRQHTHTHTLAHTQTRKRQEVGDGETQKIRRAIMFFLSASHHSLIWFPCSCQISHAHEAAQELFSVRETNSRSSLCRSILTEHTYRPCWLTLSASHWWISGI